MALVLLFTGMMIGRIAFQLLSLTLLFGWALPNSSASVTELEGEIRQIVHHLTGNVGEPLRPILNSNQILDFIKRTKIVEAIVLEDESPIPFEAEPNAQFLGSTSYQRFDDLERGPDAHKIPGYVLSERRWNQLKHPAQREAIIFHTILFNMNLENNGDFHLTRVFFEKRINFWALHQVFFKQCQYDFRKKDSSLVIQAGEIALKKRVFLQSGFNQSFWLEFQHQNGVRGELVLQAQDKANRLRDVLRWRISPYDLLSGKTPMLEFALTERELFRVECSFVNQLLN